MDSDEKKQPISIRERLGGDKKQPVRGRRQSVGDRKQSVNDGKQPVGDGRQPVSDRKQPIGDGKQPVRDRKQPMDGYKSAGGKKRGKKRRRRRLSTRGKIIITGMILAAALILVLLVLLVRAAFLGVSSAITKSKSNAVTVEETAGDSDEDISETGDASESGDTSESGDATDTESATSETLEAVSDEITSFSPTCTTETDPKNLIKSTAIQVDGEEVSSYTATDTITFESGSKYTEMDGVITFRGNNFRSSPVYGLANMTEYKLESVWTQKTGSTSYKGKTWNGSGWTGQPLITTWSKELRQHMNMYDWAKEADTLTEVIYATLDGHVYFLDLETGQATRDPLDIGFTFKGAGALDPRGYPIMYLGSGYTSKKGKSRAFIINLLDCSIMYTFGNGDSFASRACYFFDSSALVDAETDTLIYPGEDGVLYLIHLNTQYDETAGTLSIDPDHIVKWKYKGTRTTKKKYWLGMEDSAVIYEGYLFIADNGGNLMCLNLNTLELVWVQDTLDDTNCSPVMSVEDGHPYIYISTSFHKGWRASSKAPIPIFKIDAENGTIIWQTEYECSTVEDVSGGVQSTIALGQYNLSDYIYCTVARTGGASQGVLTCLKKSTGEIVWEHASHYAWSSPVCVYNSDGEGNVLYANCGGKLFLINGLTGEERDVIELSEGAIEASPAVYNDMLVIGVRASKIYGIKLK